MDVNDDDDEVRKPKVVGGRINKQQQMARTAGVARAVRRVRTDFFIVCSNYLNNGDRNLIKLYNLSPTVM